MKRWIGVCLLACTILSTGCVASARYRYRDDYRHRHYDRDHRPGDYYRR